jgi:hypothetical protein
LFEIGGVELLTFNIPQGNNLSKKIKKTFAYFFVHLPLLYYILAFQNISSLKTFSTHYWFFHGGNELLFKKIRIAYFQINFFFQE